MLKPDQIKILLSEYNASNFESYRTLYKDIHGKQYSTCGCNAKRLFKELNEYYTKINNPS